MRGRPRDPGGAADGGAARTGGRSQIVDYARAERRLRELELTVLRRVDGMMQGDFPGTAPGPGFERGEGHAYAPGDDVRRIDWKLTARAGSPYVRDTVADRELELWIVLDRSPSIQFGTARATKWELALGAVACTGFLTARSGGRVGAVVFGAGPLEIRPARAGLRAARSFVFELEGRERAEPSAERSRLAEALHTIPELARRRGPVVIISDFLGDTDWARPLRAVRARHDVLAFELVDPRERELPNLGSVVFRDPESGRYVEMPTSSRAFRARYAELSTAHRAEVARKLRDAGADHAVLSTDRDWVRDITAFLVRRRRTAGTVARPRHAVGP
jgi:uncharacterized protein (DUF58 family)